MPHHFVLQDREPPSTSLVHQVSRRLARWLLAAQDRVGSGTLGNHPRLPRDHARHRPSQRYPRGSALASAKGHSLPSHQHRHRQSLAPGIRNVPVLSRGPTTEWVPVAWIDGNHLPNKRQFSGFEDYILGALDQGMFLKDVVVAIGKVRAVMTAARFFARQRRPGDERRQGMKIS
jgi:hypothetical protein